MFSRQISFLLSLSIIASLGGGLSAQAEMNDMVNCANKTTSLLENEGPKGAQRIKLHYMRSASSLKTILDALKTQECWNVTIEKSAEDEIILYGTKDQRKAIHQVIAVMDLPRPGITMQMWGIQISSNDPKDLAKVMLKVRQEINQTQKLVRGTYARIQQYITDIISENHFDLKFKKLVEDLGYESALNSNRPLSLTDMILLMVAAEKSDTKVTQTIANELTKFIEEDKRYEYYLDTLRKEGGQPLERFFSIRGLKRPLCKKNQKNKKDVVTSEQDCKWKEEFTDHYAKVSRAIMLDFALHYGHLISKPDQFSPENLQQSADVLNNRLQDTIDALNQDIEDFFVKPTLLKIQKIVSEFKDVEYAQVGKTSVASLSGIEAEVTSNSTSVFNVTSPLKLSELVRENTQLEEGLTRFIPDIQTKKGPIRPTLGSLPLERVISLFATFQEQAAEFRQLKTGVTLTVTPNVLRNMNSAELDIDLTIVDPAAPGTSGEGAKDSSLSRIGQQKVDTTVYTKAVDFFALSTFSNQSTLNGGRGYVPVIGTVWRGVFGQVPIVGKLFSWKKGPKKVLHESLLLTNSFITPTAMGMGLLYPVDSNQQKNFCVLKEKVEQYKNGLVSSDTVEFSACNM
ncbi:MAG: hypothetical protein QNJ49_06690 [Mastigocoleus sp. MO_167.B18]|nr:hypothetical protein [Mastigocoleus sp. MO_167.B18]